MADIVWEGLAAFREALVHRVEAVHEASRGFVAEGSHVIQANMQKRAGEGGRHTKGTPTPASPGSGPAVITGNLRRSIRVGPIAGTGLGGHETDIGPTMVYARRVELDFGYPYAAPGLTDSSDELAALWTRTVDRALRG